MKYRSLYAIERALADYDAANPTKANDPDTDYDVLLKIRDIMALPDEPPPDTRYNGWTNYATWRVNLELWSDEDWSEHGTRYASVDDLATYLEEYTDDILTGYGEKEDEIALDYARSFVSDVNWYEMAESYVEDCPDLIESDDEDDDDDDEGDA